MGYDPADPFVAGKPSVTRTFPEKSNSRFGGADAAHRLYDDEQVGTTLKEKAVEWLRSHVQGEKKDHPFFMYLATTNIHHPFTPAPRFKGSSGCGLYGDFTHELDWMVGEVLNTLDELELSSNTLVIFTSDNGGMLNVTAQRARTMGHEANGELQGYKFGAWEGGHRIPLLVRWPGMVAAGTTSDALVSQVDLLATFAEIVDQPIPKGQGKDSLNQLSVMTGDSHESIRDELLILPNSPMHMGLRKGDWVYIPQRGAGGFQGKAPGNHLFSDVAALHFSGRIHSDVNASGEYKSGAPTAQLYNLKNELGQSTNVLAQNSERAATMKAALQGYRDRLPNGRPKGWINLKQSKRP